MGRALFSETHGSKALAIRVEPEPVVCPYDKWSIVNRFDPDSDEFFLNAEYEAFLDKEDEGREPSLLADSVNSSSSSSGDSDSGRDSPLDATFEGSVRMTAMWDRLVDGSATAAHSAQDDQLLADIPGYARTTRPATADAVIESAAINTRRRSVTISSIHPPSSLRNSTTATDLALATHSPRRAQVPPITIPNEPSTPSSQVAYTTQFQMMTPSPAPTVTPTRIYSWGRHQMPSSPISPSVRRTASPLTNPSARQSLAHIPARRRVQNI
ncbi:hypothetical protein C8J57DRAFT_1297417 [Mycena rebaudengoi]|nr:hypothetical protein C8J57DRAFT_1297417 [Mycena rebaudengoi]